MNADQLQSQGGGAMAGIAAIFYLAILVAVIVGIWKVFTKANEPGWASIVPIYNIIVLVKISGKPLWWVLLYFIPCANIVATIVVGIGIAKNFGKSEAYGVGLGLLAPIFFPMLGFSDARFIGTKTP